MRQLDDNDYLKTYRIYVGLKLHFNPNNNYVYKGHKSLTHLTIDSLLKRKDLGYFVAVTNEYHKQIANYMLSMFLVDRQMWVGDMLKKKNRLEHKIRISNIETINDVVYDELNQMFLITDFSFNEAINNKNNMPPIAKHCGRETQAIVNKVVDFTSCETINPLWNERKHIISSYSKLLNPSNTLYNIVNGFMNN